MKTPLLLLTALALTFAGCDVNVPPAEKNTTIVNPAEKTVEKNTTVVTPGAPAEKKTETSTTVTGPGGNTVEKKTTETR